MGGIYPLSDIRANTISDTSGNGPINLTGQSAATTVVRMNSDASTNANFSLNVSSTEDTGLGIKTVFFTSDYSNKVYAVTATALASVNATRSVTISSPLASSVVLYLWDFSSGVLNTSSSSAIHGDLA
jgi:hypothetical protein